MIAFASDHAGVALKNELMRVVTESGEECRDYGTYDDKSCDYPVYGARAARAVASGECERGILVCGTGIGISLAANKVRGIRCAVCSDVYSAEMSRRHNDANMLAIGSRVVGAGLAERIVRVWLSTPYEGGRHARRVAMITAVENGELPEEGGTRP